MSRGAHIAASVECFFGADRFCVLESHAEPNGVQGFSPRNVGSFTKKLGRANGPKAETIEGNVDVAHVKVHSLGIPFAKRLNSRALDEGSAVLLRRPNTGGGETTVNADGCRAEVLPWKTLEVESNSIRLKHLHPATNYVVREQTRPSQAASACVKNVAMSRLN